MYFRKLLLTQVFLWSQLVILVTGFELPNIFKAKPVTSAPLGGKTSSSIAEKKQQLIQAVSFTNNGKTATPEQQANVLRIVRGLELSEAKPPQNLLNDKKLAKSLLDGVWYLQYTSPSSLEDIEIDDDWKPELADEGQANIETKQVKFQGSISAVGVKVDTSNRLVQQIFDIDNNKVINNVDTDWGNIKASGTFRASPNVPGRALVAFDSIKIRLGNDEEKSPTIDLGFVFSILALVRRSKDNGWLETTFVDDTLRIGRGNKGTLFVLTRDRNAVQP